VRRRLDAELVRRGLASSRRVAVEAIEAGTVMVAGSPARTPARMVEGSEPIVVTGPPPRFVSRGGEKLSAALEQFSVDVAGRRCLDAGASTGGFTDCLLQRGAAEVVAVDVGRGQLAWSVREDPRVRVLERTNLRHLAPAEIGPPAELATADLSFISLVLVAPALARLTDADAEFVLLVKPQFEAGRARVGRGGIVRDPAVHRDVLSSVVEGLADSGIETVDVMSSPLRGADGNREFLAHARKRGTGVTRVDAATLDAVAAPDEPVDGSAEP
jgi:23S rRNA (cytidine1920-2'-O)/16S rRNA (cytidine1409-2'-O)-methyltransferase